MNMENTMKMYITADEVAELLGVSSITNIK